MVKLLASLLAAVMVLLSSASAEMEINITAVALQMPTCALTCSTKLLPVAECAIVDMRSCYCTNITLQHEVFDCVMGGCNMTDQLVASTVRQELICKGVPHPSRSKEIVRTILALTVLTYLFVGLRLISRCVVSTLWWDDWLMILTAVLLIPMAFIAVFNAQRGFGTHAWDVPPKYVLILRQLYYASQILYVLIQNLVKISILLLYLRIFPTQSFRNATNAMLAWQVCHTLAFLVAVTLQCIPISAVWTLDPNAKCVNSTGMVYSGAVLSILEDLVIMALPVRELKRLNLSLRKRVALIFMFALGSFACVTSMVRLKYIVSFSSSSLDITWDNVDVVIWSGLEAEAAMITASLMSIRPLLVKVFPSLFPSTHAHEYSNSASWRPKEANTLSGRIWGGGRSAAGSEVELKSHDDEDGKSGDIKVRTEFEIREATLNHHASGSESGG